MCCGVSVEEKIEYKTYDMGIKWTENYKYSDLDSIEHLFGFDIPETESVSISEYTEMYLDKLDRYEDLSSSLSLSSGISISVCSDSDSSVCSEDLNGTSWEEIIIR